MFEKTEKPKLSISLVGISHLIHTERWPISRSYEHCYDNFVTELLEPLSKKFDIVTNLTTYHSDKFCDIVEKYKPTSFQFLPLKGSHQVKTFIKSIDQLDNLNIDYVLYTRFDIIFQPGELKKLNINLNSFNFLCKEKGYWDSHHFVNDCLYFMPYKMLPDFKQACLSLICNPPRPGLMDMHGLYNTISHRVKINFMVDEHHLSSGNNIYSLKRI